MFLLVLDDFFLQIPLKVLLRMHFFQLLRLVDVQSLGVLLYPVQNLESFELGLA